MIGPADRARIVAEALSWEGTPYHSLARIKGVGADCAMFPAEVYAACGLIPRVPDQSYPPDWHLHRTYELYLNTVLDHGIETDAAEPGNFVLFLWGRVFAHGAIILRWPEIIHAVVDEGVVRGDATKGLLAKRPHRLFTVKEAAP